MRRSPASGSSSRKLALDQRDHQRLGQGHIAGGSPGQHHNMGPAAVGISKEHGLGISESELKVFQPFFLQVDLPFSGIRGEVLPAKIRPIQLPGMHRSRSRWNSRRRTSTSYWTALAEQLPWAKRHRRRGVPGQLTKIGKIELEVSARSAEAADAVIKEMIVEPEGVPEELVENLVLTPGNSHTFDGAVPFNAVDDSARTLVSVTGSYVAQTIDGLEGLLKMPFGCGEQNMILSPPTFSSPTTCATLARSSRKSWPRPRILCLPLPAGANLPQARRKFLRIRRQRSRRQPVAHRLRPQDFLPGQRAGPHRP